jgi:hypothetical protein
VAKLNHNNVIKGTPSRDLKENSALLAKAEKSNITNEPLDTIKTFL